MAVAELRWEPLLVFTPLDPSPSVGYTLPHQSNLMKQEVGEDVRWAERCQGLPEAQQAWVLTSPDGR